MAISPKLLNDGESVIIDTRTHVKALLVPLLLLVLSLGLPVFGTVSISALSGAGAMMTGARFVGAGGGGGGACDGVGGVVVRPSSVASSCAADVRGCAHHWPSRRERDRRHHSIATASASPALSNPSA